MDWSILSTPLLWRFSLLWDLTVYSLLHVDWTHPFTLPPPESQHYTCRSFLLNLARVLSKSWRCYVSLFSWPPTWISCTKSIILRYLSSLLLKLFADLIKSFPTLPRQYTDSTWVSTQEITILPGLPSHFDKSMSAHLSKHDIEMSENDTEVFKYDTEMFHWN